MPDQTNKQQFSLMESVLVLAKNQLILAEAMFPSFNKVLLIENTKKLIWQIERAISEIKKIEAEESEYNKSTN